MFPVAQVCLSLLSMGDHGPLATKSCQPGTAPFPFPSTPLHRTTAIHPFFSQISLGNPGTNSGGSWGRAGKVRQEDPPCT